MGVNSSNHHPVLLHQPEPRRGLPRSSNNTFPFCLLCSVSESSRTGVSHVRHIDEQKPAYTEAIPEHLASRFNPTRSASNSCLAFPLTMATLVLVLGGTTDPSSINHSTLGMSICTGTMNGIVAYLHPAYLNTSSKNGTPARIPFQ